MPTFKAIFKETSIEIKNVRMCLQAKVEKKVEENFCMLYEMCFVCFVEFGLRKEKDE